jgi:hypothetical protein
MEVADGYRRSVWRETKLLFNVLVNNLLDIELILQNFIDIAGMLFVEKRKSGRKLQLAPG